jgi:hypothetical protein
MKEPWRCMRLHSLAHQAHRRHIRTWYGGILTKMECGWSNHEGLHTHRCNVNAAGSSCVEIECESWSFSWIHHRLSYLGFRCWRELAPRQTVAGVKDIIDINSLNRIRITPLNRLQIMLNREGEIRSFPGSNLGTLHLNILKEKNRRVFEFPRLIN